MGDQVGQERTAMQIPTSKEAPYVLSLAQAIQGDGAWCLVLELCSGPLAPILRAGSCEARLSAHGGHELCPKGWLDFLQFPEGPSTQL